MNKYLEKAAEIHERDWRTVGDHLTRGSLLGYGALGGGLPGALVGAAAGQNVKASLIGALVGAGLGAYANNKYFTKYRGATEEEFNQLRRAHTAKMFEDDYQTRLGYQQKSKELRDQLALDRINYEMSKLEEGEDY